MRLARAKQSFFFAFCSEKRLRRPTLTKRESIKIELNSVRIRKFDERNWIWRDTVSFFCRSSSLVLLSRQHDGTWTHWNWLERVSVHVEIYKVLRFMTDICLLCINKSLSNHFSYSNFDGKSFFLIFLKAFVFFKSSAIKLGCRNLTTCNLAWLSWKNETIFSTENVWSDQRQKELFFDLFRLINHDLWFRNNHSWYYAH